MAVAQFTANNARTKMTSGPRPGRCAIQCRQRENEETSGPRASSCAIHCTKHETKNGPADQELVVAQFTAYNAKPKRDQRTNSWQLRNSLQTTRKRERTSGPRAGSCAIHCRQRENEKGPADQELVVAQFTAHTTRNRKGNSRPRAGSCATHCTHNAKPKREQRTKSC